MQRSIAPKPQTPIETIPEKTIALSHQPLNLFHLPHQIDRTINLTTLHERSPRRFPIIHSIVNFPKKLMSIGLKFRSVEFLKCFKRSFCKRFNLGEQLGIELAPSQEMTVELILEQIKGLLKGCNIFFIEVNLPDLEGNCEFVSWFVEEFWGRVIDRMPEFLAENKSALFIGVMTLETDLEKDFLKDRSCTPAKFADGKFVVLQQEKWKEDDIRVWMQKFSRLPLSADQIEKVPKSIWRSAEGLPFATEVKLLQELDRLAS